jgi:hypothetical protein
MQVMPKARPNFNNLFQYFLERNVLVPCWANEDISLLLEYTQDWLNELRRRALPH